MGNLSVTGVSWNGDRQMIDGVSGAASLAISGPAQNIPQGQGQAQAVGPTQAPPPAQTVIEGPAAGASGGGNPPAPSADSGRGTVLDIAV